MSPGLPQILLIIVIIMLVFGAGRLPRIMEDVAKGIKGFKKGMKDEDDATTEDKKGITSHSNDDVIDAEVSESVKTED